MRNLVVLAILAGLFLAGCAAPGPGGNNTTGQAPSFTITAPSQGATVQQGTVNVNMAATGFSPSSPGGSHVSGRGHFRLYLDSEPYVTCASLQCTLSGVGPGSHTLRVEMRTNNNQIYAGVPSRTVNFMVAGATNGTNGTGGNATTPSFSVLYPSQGGTVPSGSFNVQISASNLQIMQPGGQNVQGQGHFHAYLDNGPAIICASTTCPVANVTPGAHTLRVEMQQNDHSVYPGVSPRTISITATGSAGGNGNGSLEGTPRFQLLFPTNDSVVSEGPIMLQFQLSNFSFGTVGSANAENQGHFRVFVDNSQEYTTCVMLRCFVQGVSPGSHVLRVQMHTNEGAAYGGMQPVVLSVSVGEATNFTEGNITGEGNASGNATGNSS